MDYSVSAVALLVKLDADASSNHEHACGHHRGSLPLYTINLTHTINLKPVPSRRSSCSLPRAFFTTAHAHYCALGPTRENPAHTRKGSGSRKISPSPYKSASGRPVATDSSPISSLRRPPGHRPCLIGATNAPWPEAQPHDHPILQITISVVSHRRYHGLHPVAVDDIPKPCGNPRDTSSLCVE